MNKKKQKKQDELVCEKDMLSLQLTAQMKQKQITAPTSTSALLYNSIISVTADDYFVTAQRQI